MVWVDDSAGDFVWSINPWGINAISKNDASTPLLGESGEVIEDGSSTGGSGLGPAEPNDDTGTVERRPDDNGIDDPPVAIDDPVTSRSGKAVPVVVTANDYDPDGEAIAVVEVGTPSHGTVDVASASTVVYQPEPGFVGLDRFDYTIVDGNGTEASASVILELLPADAPNRAPVARNDVAETGPDVGVIIDVLLNDVDPERDALRVASFTPPDIGGVVTETIGPSGLPALHYQPPLGVSGRATFTYRPSDTFEGTGEPATVRVEIAQPQRREPPADRAARCRPAPPQHADRGAGARQRSRPGRRPVAALGGDAVAARARGRGRRRPAARHRTGRRRRARAVHVPRRRPERQRRSGNGAGRHDLRHRAQPSTARDRRHRDRGGRHDAGDRRAVQRQRPRRRSARRHCRQPT